MFIWETSIDDVHLGCETSYVSVRPTLQEPRSSLVVRWYIDVNDTHCSQSKSQQCVQEPRLTIFVYGCQLKSARLRPWTTRKIRILDHFVQERHAESPPPLLSLFLIMIVHILKGVMRTPDVVLVSNPSSWNSRPRQTTTGSDAWQGTKSSWNVVRILLSHVLA